MIQNDSTRFFNWWASVVKGPTLTNEQFENIIIKFQTQNNDSKLYQKRNNRTF